MSRIIASMSMSLDGFIAGPEHRIDEVFSWHHSGDEVIPVTIGDQPYEFKVGPVNAEYIRRTWGECGAILCGRALFDMTGGWGGRHPVDRPIVCYSRGVPEGWEDRDEVVFADTIEEAAAVAKKLAGDGFVGTSGTRTVANLLNAGLLDGIEVNLVPYLLGKGHRFFDGLSTTPIALDGPEVIEGEGVTHLRYTVRK
ncbi:dihydrofolate reductase family protein [Phytomonospora endophytica]|uniref:Dihydrofolate reductase n=1 Tax=Phytomonospora endophytica TaxID=714109 RepID=A0A841FW10_9ACTN|nr:dihydrofolate reductase family protein [Phytomonospora endophytica]MBB6038943.1 dihydrofolate reductase [Phytomonospora endophytica]GIG67955.1 deaminase [Phytomonospora endophytica]